MFDYDVIHPRVGKKAIEDVFTTQESLHNRMVVYRERGSKYHVYRSHSDLYEYMMGIAPADRNFHEVIFGWMKQKIKFDFDFTTTNDEFGATAARNYLQELRNAISSAFYTHYDIDLGDNATVYNSSGAHDTEVGKYKYSYHIVIDGYYVSDNIEASTFTKYVVELLAPETRHVVDVGVNKSVQNFRIYGNSKLGSVRAKGGSVRAKGGVKGDVKGGVKCRAGTDGGGNGIITLPQYLNSLITYVVGCIPLKSINTTEHEIKHSNEEIEFADESIAMESIPPEYTRGHVFRRRVGMRLEYNRVASTWCNFCKRNHDSDNTLMFDIHLSQTTNAYSIFMKCRRDISKGSEYVGGFTTDKISTDTRSIGELILERELLAIKGGGGGDAGGGAGGARADASPYPRGFIKTLFDELSDECKLVYDEPKLRNFERAHTLCVRAQMKMGKTRALAHHIATYYSSELNPPRIVFVSFRQTFSREIKAKFNDFTLYSDVKGELKQRKVIVQVESLHRLRVGEPVDLLVLDESESIFEQFSSNLGNRNSLTWATFVWLMKHSKHVIAMDANMGDRTYTMCSRLRTGKINYHCNTHQNDTGTYHMTTNKNEWLLTLYHMIKRGDKVAIPTSSLGEAETIHRTLKSDFNHLNIVLYTSKTSNTEKREHFSDVNTYWARFDVLIYTPTVSAGVSFEIAHFDSVFGYFIDKSCGVETCHQMLGRIRNVKSCNYYICINATFNNLPTDRDAITKYITSKRASALNDIDDGYLQYAYNPAGELSVIENDYLVLWVENQRVANLSKNKFAHRFIGYINSYGGKIITLDASALTGIPPEELETAVENVGANHTDTKKQIKAEDAQSIAEARDISHDEASIIKDAIARMHDEDNNSECVEIDAETRREYEKYRIRNIYGWVAEIDMEFVQRYGADTNTHIFRNLRNIANGDNCDDALKIIHRRERNTVANLSTLGGGGYYANISRYCVYGKHRAAILLVRSCGFADLFDKQILSHPRVVGKLRTSHTAVASTMDVASNDMGISQPSHSLNITHYGDDRYITSMLKYVNRVLNHMYGAEIKSTADKLYSIRLSGVFDYAFGEGGGDDGNGDDFIATKPTVCVYGEAPYIGDHDDEVGG